MNFEAHTRSQAQILLDTIANHVADTARSELDALRAIVEERAAALQEALSYPDQQSILERLVQDVSKGAREQAEAIAAKARAEVESRGEAELAAAREVATAQAEAAQAVNTALLGNIEEAQQQLRTVQAAARADFDRAQELEERLEQVQATHAGLAAGLADTERDLAAARSERDTQTANLEQAKKNAHALHEARQELEARLEQMQTEHAAVAATLADTERDLAAVRSARDAQTASFEQAKKSAHALQQERKQLVLARDETSKLLEVEKRRASELAGTLETARQQANLAKVEADRHRDDMKLATDRIESLEEELTRPDSDTRPRPRLEEERTHTGVMLLEEVRSTLQSMYAATTANEILETLIEQLGHHFSKAAVFMMGPAGARGWRAHSFGTTTDISSVAIPRAISALLARASIDRKPVAVAGGGEDLPAGLSNNPIGSGVALPILARGQVIAVAYVEDAQSSDALASVGYKIAEMLIDHVSRRLTTKRTSGQAPMGAPQDIDRLAASPGGDEARGAYSLAHHEPA